MSRLLYLTFYRGGAGLRRWSRAALMLALPAFLSQWPVAANPTQPVVTHGSATFSTQGPQLTIHTGGNAVINWSGFNIAAGESTTFIEPSSTSVVWNHISDPNPTQILGHLDANGYVVLQNQSGFYIGGNAVINAAGLVMTTTPAIPLDVFGGGSWQFTAPPPTARIINYGEINAGPAGSVFLISQDIENHGDITAPAGNIGLCAGEQVLMSTRADGRGLSAAVTLPQGSVDNSGRLIADAGTIALHAQVVNQGGLIQANSVRNHDGVIEIVASDDVTLGAGSSISARGDTRGASAGGEVTIKSGNTFNDTSTSVIDVSGGAQGGDGGQVEISASQINAIQSRINGHADEGWTGGKLVIDPVNITINSAFVNSLDYLSSIDLQASGNIMLATPWSVLDNNSGSFSTLTLQAGGNIIFNGGDSLTVGKNWNVNLVAGANFDTLTSVTASSTIGSILMIGNAGVKSVNGDINLIAGDAIAINSGTIESTGGGLGSGIGCGNILLQAMAQNIVLGNTSPWVLPDSSTSVSLTLQSGTLNGAGGKIVMSGAITAGWDWNVNLVAGANFSSLTSVTPNSTTGASSILMVGNAGVQSANGNINLIAGGKIAITSGTIESTGVPLGNPNDNEIVCGNILLQAMAQNIALGNTAPWILPDSSTPASVTVQSGAWGGLGGNILMAGGITAGKGWTVDLVAGANFNSLTGVTANSTSGASSLTLGNGNIQSDDGNITLAAGNTLTTSSANILSTGGGSILLQAMKNINVGTWNLADLSAPNSVILQSVGNITIGGGITGGQNWTLDLVAGATSLSPSAASVDTSSKGVNTTDTGSVILGGSLQTENGGINVTAGGSVIIGTLNGNTVAPGEGSITTIGVSTPGGTIIMDGGNITVDAVGGNVNTGENGGGYNFRFGPGYAVPGGISTAAGGNVAITAGGNVTSYLPTGISTSDAGSGAFGPEPGVVTIRAGGSVYGHYVAANSTENGVVVPSTITAQNGNAGSTSSVSDYLALSLITGSWIVNAPNGSINLQEVRNPNGAFNDTGIGAAAAQNNMFNYSPDAAVTLNAGKAVNLLGTSLPRDSGQSVPCIYPPSLTINAGSGGVTLGSDVTLFPSPDGELTINTTGTFQGNNHTLAMSDSGATRWIGPGQPGATDFASDHAAIPIQLNNNQPVVFNIGGDLDDVTIFSPKATQVTVGGNMNNVSFTGQNLHSTDTTFFHVAGEIFDQNTYAFETLSTPLALPAPLYQGGMPNYFELLQNAVVPGTGPNPGGSGPQSPFFPSLDLFYLPGTQQLGYFGVMSSATEAMLLGTLQEITYLPNGKPILDVHGNYVTTPVTFAGSPGSTLYQAIQALYAASQNSVNNSQAPQGILIGGPGQLVITAQSMNLGASAGGVSSVGPAINNALADLTTQFSGNHVTAEEGATIKIDLTGDLDMFASEVSSWYGGAIDVNVGGSINAGLGHLPFQGTAPHGIWTSADSDVSVIAQGDINIQGSRIAAYDGGNIFVESQQGSVDAGNGGLGEVQVNEVRVNPKTGAVTQPLQAIAGSGILATTLPDANSGLAVGNITVDTPHGNIEAGLGGITQEPNNGNTSLAPTVTLTAGGNIDAGDSGVIAINVNASAAGKVTGLFISSGNSTIHGDTINVTDLAGGTASLSASGSITGTIIAGSGISIGSGSFAGVALSQNVSGGGAQSALASAASASAGSQTSAAGEASSQKSETSDQPTSTDTDDDLKRARAHPLLAKYTGRVTVLLPNSAK
jgi:filamentous hemagglutinin family protein